MPINDQITATRVRLIDQDGTQLGIMTIDRALEQAEAKNLDLVQMADGDMAVCKLMNYGRHLFERKKQDAEARRKRKRIQLKEVKFRLSIDEHDYQVKLRSVRGFIENGDRVKAVVRFRGREITHKELGLAVLDKLRADTEDMSTVEKEPLQEGRQIVMILVPLGRRQRKAGKPPQGVQGSAETGEAGETGETGETGENNAKNQDA